MASTINPNIPVDNSPAIAAEMRDQFGRAITDIEALQTGKEDSGTAAVAVAAHNVDGAAHGGVETAFVAHRGSSGLAEHALADNSDPGFLRALSGDSSEFLDGSGNFSTPPGISNHSLLSNRDDADSHPISAVTGLQTALDGKMDLSVYDPGATGVVNAAAAVGLELTNQTGSPLSAGQLITFDAAGNILALANASTSDWAQGMIYEAIAPAATGRVIQFGFCPANTLGYAIDDIIYLADNGTFTGTPTLVDAQRQQIGTVISIGNPGWVYIQGDLETLEADGALGSLNLTDAAGQFDHVSSSPTAWTEIVPGAGDVTLLNAVNTVIGTNNGRLRLDYTSADIVPEDGTVAGNLVLSVSVEFPAQGNFFDISAAVNGTIVSADVQNSAQIGGNQVAGTSIPMTISFPVVGLSPNDELSIVARATPGTYPINAFSITFVSQGGGTGGPGGGSSDHQALTNRGATGAHPGTAVSVTPSGDITETNAQAALYGLDARKANKTSGVPDGNLAMLVSDDLADSSITGANLVTAATAYTAGRVVIAADNARGTDVAGFSELDVQTHLDATNIHFTAASLAGAGMAEAAGALNIGAGTGITVSASDISVVFAGSGGAASAARSDHDHTLNQIGTGGLANGAVTRAKEANMAANTLRLREATPGVPTDVEPDNLQAGVAAAGDAIVGQKFGGQLVKFDPSQFLAGVDGITKGTPYDVGGLLYASANGASPEAATSPINVLTGGGATITTDLSTPAVSTAYLPIGGTPNQRAFTEVIFNGIYDIGPADDAGVQIPNTGIQLGHAGGLRVGNPTGDLPVTRGHLNAENLAVNNVNVVLSPAVMAVGELYAAADVNGEQAQATGLLANEVAFATTAIDLGNLVIGAQDGTRRLLDSNIPFNSLVRNSVTTTIGEIGYDATPTELTPAANTVTPSITGNGSYRVAAAHADVLTIDTSGEANEGAWSLFIPSGTTGRTLSPAATVVVGTPTASVAQWLYWERTGTSTLAVWLGA